MMDAEGVAALAIFIGSMVAMIALVSFPVSIPVWRTKYSLPLSFAIPPVLGVMAMLCCGSITWTDVAVAIRGNSQMQPYGIVVLFMSTAYMCGTLDLTGAFSWLSLKFTKLSRGHGRLLFVCYYCLAGGITLVTSNDIVVMTLTPIVCHFAAATATDPLPFLAAQFSSANLWSMALLIGNPTNVIVGEAAGVGFATYSQWMTLPTVVAGLVCLLALCLRYWHAIPARLHLPAIDARLLLRDPAGAAFGTLNILLCLGLLAGSERLGVEMWVITLANAGLALMWHLGACLAAHWRRPAQLTDLLRQLQRKQQWQREAEGRQQRRHAAVPDVDAPASGGDTIHTSPAMPTPTTTTTTMLTTTATATPTTTTTTSAAAAPAARAAPPHPPDTAMADPEAGHQHQPLSDSPAGQPTHHHHQRHNHHHERRDRPNHQPHCPPDQAPDHHPAAPSDRHVHHHPPDGLHPPQNTQSFGTTPPIPPPSSNPPPSSIPPPSSFPPTPDHPNTTTKAVDPQPPPPPPPPAPLTPWQALLLGFANLPWDVPPFVLAMFVQVQGLAVNGWTDRLGALLAAASGSTMSALLANSFAAILLSNLLNNQPMTILMTKVLLGPAFSRGVGPGRQRAALLALVAGSNLGANFTLIGALAGIMWCKILARNGVRMSYVRFVWLLAPWGVVTTLAMCGMLWVRLTYMG